MTAAGLQFVMKSTAISQSLLRCPIHNAQLAEFLTILDRFIYQYHKYLNRVYKLTNGIQWTPQHLWMSERLQKQALAKPDQSTFGSVLVIS